MADRSRKWAAVADPRSLYNPDYNNFAPRVAFAYDVTGKGRTVIRGGWGMFYDAFSQDIFLGHLPWNCVFCPGPAYPGTGPVGLAVRKRDRRRDETPTQPSRFTPASVRTAISSRPIRNMRTPYTQNFNLNFQQQIG